MMTAYVVFTDSNYKPLRLLKSGYRHCYLILRTDNNIVMYDVRFNGTKISTYNTSILSRLLNDKNYIKVDIPDNLPQSPRISVLSCVTTVKSVLGIRNIFIQTPYGLHRYLQGTG